MPGDEDELDADLAALRDLGFARKAGLVDRALIDAARQAIDADVSADCNEALLDYYNHVSWCPGLRESPTILALLSAPVRAWLDRLYGAGRWDRLGGAQIAIRRRRETMRPVDANPHIDGNWAFGARCADDASVHDGILGIFLTDVDARYAGNLTVWPGSHARIAAHFRAVGTDRVTAGLPAFGAWAGGEAEQLCTQAGEVVLMHGLLAHAGGWNAGPDDRIAVYFRIEPRGSRARQDLYERLTAPPFL